jgi:hypothetical protein
MAGVSVRRADKYRARCRDAGSFRTLLKRVHRAVAVRDLRNGAFSWRLHEDLGSLNTYRVELMIPPWTEYLLEQERMTKSEKEAIDKAWALHIGENPQRSANFPA